MGPQRSESQTHLRAIRGGESGNLPALPGAPPAPPTAATPVAQPPARPQPTHPHPHPIDELERERSLVARCKAGERSAQDELYRTHRRLVAGNLYRVLGNPAELEDLIQEVFVIAFRGIARFRGESRLTTWLYRIAVNVALQRLRTRSRRPAATAPPGEDDMVTEENPERELMRKHEVAAVYRLLDKLAPKKRVVLVLHEIEGLDVGEIADIVGSPQVTVRTRLHYARKEFYKLASADSTLDERRSGRRGTDQGLTHE